jgi:hypothetical protein
VVNFRNNSLVKKFLCHTEYKEKLQNVEKQVVLLPKNETIDNKNIPFKN